MTARSNHGAASSGQMLLPLPPSPDALIASLRDIGYSFQTAIADLIDNSITAQARRIDIVALWNQGHPTVAVIDDGVGMNKAELCAAMRFGSTSPLEVRAAGDMGRFGLGLKTASISQCLHLQVLSKKDGEIWNAAWDLDRICRNHEEEWQIALENGDSVSDMRLRELVDKHLASRHSGTIVFWSRMDRMEQDATNDSFNTAVANLRRHLGLTFHRLIKPKPGDGKGISIFVNNRAVEAFDPFNVDNLACQEFPEETIKVEGSLIKAQAYVLPHFSKTTAEEYERFGGTDGYRGSQGFYVYRNKRLIISGTWFRLRPRTELTKLVRIRVDIPNSLDSIWKIDIKKSGADLPESVRKELAKVYGIAVKRSEAVVHHRGYTLPTAVAEPVWTRTEVDKTISYSVNRQSYAFKNLVESFSEEQREPLLSFVRLLESRLPTEQLYADICDKPKSMRQVALPTEVLELFLESYLSNHPDATLEEILTVDPFFLYEEDVRRLWDKRKRT